MNPWTAVLESFHSALVDELIERHPNPKPLLGMPNRRGEFSVPDPALVQLLLCEVLFPDAVESKGFAALAFDKIAQNALNTEPAKLWESLTKRVRIEFAWHEIRPVLGKLIEAEIVSADEIRQNGNRPLAIGKAKRVIWIPIRLGEGLCYFGIGV